MNLLGYSAVQVRPAPAQFRSDATKAMFKKLKLTTGSSLRALVDVQQPGTHWQARLYREGAAVGRVTVGEGLLVEGSLLWRAVDGPWVDGRIRAAVTGRYTWALLADGSMFPVCIAWGGPEGRMPRQPGTTSGTVQFPRDAPVNAVRRWL